MLHEWLGHGRRNPSDVDVLSGIFDAVGAIVMGRRSFDVSNAAEIVSTCHGSMY